MKKIRTDVPMLYKLFSNDSEWDIFQNILATKKLIYTKSNDEKLLFEYLKSSSWSDNTSTRPDFISDRFMIELFEVDDIVSTKKGRNNPQRKADARALRTIEDFMKQFPEGTFHEDVKIIAHGDTRYNPVNDTYTPDDSISHHNYRAYLNNFTRITQKHLNSISAYRENFPNKKLGFMILDDSTYYIPQNYYKGKATQKQIFLQLPFFDKNFMRLLIKSDVDFLIWAFDNKYVYTDTSGFNSTPYVPQLAIISKENFYTKYSRYFFVDNMVSLEE